MKQAIGVIDSGIGGLTVAKEIMRQLPKENIIYLGDTARCPYGPRSQEEVLAYTWEMVDFLLDKNIKALVIACNTATAFSLASLKKELQIPVIGVIQAGSRAAITATKSGEVGVIGTEGTIRSGAYERALLAIDSNVHTESLACPLFVPMVERGVLEGDKAYDVVKTSLAPLLQYNGIDTLILGCTHYPLLQRTIQQVVGPSVTLISSSDETARETSTILDMQNLLVKTNEVPHHEIYTTGNLDMFKSLLSKIFPNQDNKVKTMSIQKTSIK